MIILSETVPLFPEHHNISSQESKDKTEKKHRLFCAHGEAYKIGYAPKWPHSPRLSRNPMGGLEGRRPATSIVVLATAVASPRSHPRFDRRARRCRVMRLSNLMPPGRFALRAMAHRASGRTSQIFNLGHAIPALGRNNVTTFRCHVALAHSLRQPPSVSRPQRHARWGRKPCEARFPCRVHRLGRREAGAQWAQLPKAVSDPQP